MGGKILRRLPRGLRSGFCASWLLFAALACAQPAPYEPQIGQKGKDVIWLPTPQPLVNRMLQLARLTPQDFLVDLGSGDGRTVITAARRGARSHGIEYNAELVELARHNAARAGVAKLATFEHGDIFQSDFSKASVVTLFLLPALNLKLRPVLLAMKPGTRIIANSFDMADWKADRTAQVGGDCTPWCTAYLWVVPAKVEGAWQSSHGELNFTQKYQQVSGSLTVNGSVATLTHVWLDGARFGFRVGRTVYSGVVRDDIIDGTMTVDNKAAAWTARRSR